MIKKLLCAAAAISALTAQAGPVEPTTIVDGNFAPETTWYTMQIHAPGYVLSDEVDDAGAMPLSRTETTYAGGDLWCFVGNDTDGYKIYNRAAGTAKSLAAPTTMTGTTGSTSYPILREPGISGQCYDWNFTTGSLAGSWFMYEMGHTANKVNVRDGRLAFWTGGADNGSSIVIKPYTKATLEGNKIIVNQDPLTTLSGDIAPTTNPDGSFNLGSCLYSFTTPEGQVVRDYTIILADGTSRTVHGRGETNDQLAINGPVENVENILVNVYPALEMATTGYAVFRFDRTPGFTVTYRIPSIVTVQAGPHKGRIYSVNDYRYCGGDIGAGRIDLYQSYSDDNGATWTTPDVMRNKEGKPVAMGTGKATPAGTKQSETNLDCGFGDPATVSDRETGDIFMVACTGRMNFFSSRRDDPQPSARWWSTDGGETWTEPDFTQWEQVYSLFDDNCINGYIDGQFIGSGRMVQSSRIKVGTHYRIYAVMSGRHAASGNISNWVLYSDDFGHNWNILGDPYNPAVSAGADEPKCEELPDGSILLAARGNGGGRNFNIFRYTDIEKAQGRWDTHINTNLGTGHGINACNGEIMILPVKNTTDGQKAFIALQTFPNSTKREKVTVAWKILASPADYDTPSDFATWNGFFLLSPGNSTYSTMTLQHDNKVGFMWEEDTFTNGISEIYRALTISEITDGAWEYSPDSDGSLTRQHADESVTNRTNDVAGQPDNVVGYHTPEGKKAVADASAAYFANPSDKTMSDFNAACFSELLQPVSGGIYSFKSAHGGTYNIQGDRWLAAGNTALSIASAESDDTRFIVFNHTDTVPHFALYNASRNRYATATPEKTETVISTAEKSYNAGLYNFKVDPGKVSIICQNGGHASYYSIHMNGSQKPVIWTIDAAASKWVMTFLGMADELPEPDKEQSAIAEINTDTTNASARYYDLSGREVATPRRGQLLISTNGRKHLIP